MRSGGCRWEGGIQEAIMNMRSLCFYFSALELSTQLFVEYIDCHAILMTPSTRIFPDSLLIGPRFLFRTKKYSRLVSFVINTWCLGMRQPVLI